jgi:hypothetical protein
MGRLHHRTLICTLIEKLELFRQELLGTNKLEARQMVRDSYGHRVTAAFASLIGVQFGQLFTIPVHTELINSVY